MDIEKYKNRGYTGLTNLGNTCFLNSSIQVLNHTYELIELVNSEKTERISRKKIPDTVIVKEWKDLWKIMWTNTGVVSPNKFVYNVHKLALEKNREIFTGWAQNDMPEFLLFTIECMHNSLARSVNMNIKGDVKSPVDKLAVECYRMLQASYEKEYSEIMDLFYGIYVSEITSVDNSIKHSVKAENFFILDLPISNADTTLYGCFDAFTQYETMEGDNAWMNEATGQKETVKKGITFWNFPKILVITMKRFSPCGRFKRNELIDFPIETLDLSKYVSGYNKHQFKYDLYGVCNHSGNVMGGHYTSFVKCASGDWIHYNDTNVTVVKNPREIVSPMAYCLFYRKKNNFV